MVHFTCLKKYIILACFCLTLILACFCPALAPAAFRPTPALAADDENQPAQGQESEAAQGLEGDELKTQFLAQTQEREQYEAGHCYDPHRPVRDGAIRESFHWQDDPLYEDPATHYRVWIRDSEGRLAEDEKAQLLESMKALAAYGNVTFDLNSSEGDAAEYYDMLYRDQGYADDSGILLVVCEGSRTVSLFCQGKVQDHIDGKTAFEIGTRSSIDLRHAEEQDGMYFMFARKSMAYLLIFLSASGRSVNPESGCTAWVMDGGQMFSAEKRQEILEAARDLAKDTNIVVATGDYYSDWGKWPFEIPYTDHENYLQIYLNDNKGTMRPILSIKTGETFPEVVSDNELKTLALMFTLQYDEEKIGSWLGQIYEAVHKIRSHDEITVSADSGYEIRITDTEDILSDKEEQQLLEIMKPVAEYGNVAFESYASRESGEDYCRKKYRDKGFFDRSGTVFLVNMYERYLWLYTGGEMEKTISARRAVSITDNVYRLASSGQYYACAAKVFDQEKTLLRGGFILQPMRLICCLAIAFALSLLAVYKLICKERGIKSMLPKRIISMSGEVALAGAAAVTVTKTVVNSDSGGGGSSHGGGGFSGGGFSGGGFSGGGHKF